MLRSAVAVLLVVGVAMGARVKTSKLESEPAAPVSGQHSGWQQPHHQQPEHHGWEQPKQHGWEQQQHHEPEHRGWEQPKQHGWEEPKHHGWEEPKQHGWEEPKHDGWQQPKHEGWSKSKPHASQQWGRSTPFPYGAQGWHSDHECCDEDLTADSFDSEGDLERVIVIEVRKSRGVWQDGLKTLVNSEIFIEVTFDGTLATSGTWGNGPRTYLRPVGRFIAEVQHLPAATCQESASISHGQYIFRDCVQPEGRVNKRQFDNGWWDDDEEELEAQLSTVHVSNGEVHAILGPSYGHNQGWSKSSCCAEYPGGAVIGSSGEFTPLLQAVVSHVHVHHVHQEDHHGETYDYYAHVFEILDLD